MRHIAERCVTQSRPAGRSSLATCRAGFSFGRPASNPKGDDGLDFAPARSDGQPPQQRRPSDFGMTDAIACLKMLGTWKPLLLLRLSGLLLRLSDRTFCALLLNDLPRNTRLLGLRPLEFDCSEHPTA
jgi:hypothetical protein